jgi:hypothetical protein
MFIGNLLLLFEEKLFGFLKPFDDPAFFVGPTFVRQTPRSMDNL